MGRIAGVALAVLLLNLPFGYWRAAVRKFSLPWFVAVHGAVPLVIALRIVAGLGWQLRTVPILVGAYLGGQLLGGGLLRLRRGGGAPPGAERGAARPTGSRWRSPWS
jgi:hypothetical protein